MNPEPLHLSSLANPRVKGVVKLRQRSHRDDAGLLLIEGYREIKRALDNRYALQELFTCRELFQGENEDALIDRARTAGATVLTCTEAVFRKMAYRDRPEGLLALGPKLDRQLADLELPPAPLLLVAEAVEKPGNLGSMLRSADAAGVSAVIVCDPRTDVNNPNVVRASIGCLFAVPVVATDGARARHWLAAHGVRTLAASPHADRLYTDSNMTGPTAIVMGTEQVGLSEEWMRAADRQVRIPMRGQADSLNVAAAATILLYEAVRQRGGRPLSA